MITHGDIYVDSAWQRADSMRTTEVVNPTTEEVIAHVVDANERDVDAAVTAASRAFPAWRDLPVTERVRHVVALADELARRGDELARLITTENGTPITETLYSAPTGAAHLRHVASLGPQLFAEDVRGNPMVKGGRSLVRRVPVGVAALITPWNFPLSLILVKLGPALVAGCTVVIKPAPETPLAARALMDLVSAVGLPRGVVNLVTGGVETGRALVSHPRVDKVSFTGSTVAGRAIGATCGELLRPVTLELGGKSAALVLDDVDANVLAANILKVSMRNTGQTCKASTRLLVPESRAKELTELVADVVGKAQLGDPFDAKTFFGPLASRRHRARVRSYIELGNAEGARAVVGGSTASPTARGFYVQPTVFDRVQSPMRIAQEEIFGPVLAVLTYSTIDEAVQLANDSAYGLAGAVFGTDEDRALAVAERIDTGTIGINHYGSNAAAPFSGHKDSGVGVEFGIEGLQSYLSYTSIHFQSAR